MKPVDELTLLLRAWREDINSTPFPDMTELLPKGQKQ
jgi:hypothetical protein